MDQVLKTNRKVTDPNIVQASLIMEREKVFVAVLLTGTTTTRMRTTLRYVCYATTSVGTKRVRGDRLTLLADFGVTRHTVLNLRRADPVRRRDGRGGRGRGG